MDTSKSRGPGQNKRFWNEDEDKFLIEALIELHNEGMYKAEGNFKAGHLKALEKKLHNKLRGCDLLARPHIESRMKTLKTHFQVVHEMLTGANCSGFGWDLERKTLTAEKPVWEAYFKSHKEAIPFKTKAFPYYDDLCMIFGKDRATGRGSETAADVVEELEKEGGDGVNIDDDYINDIHNMMGVDEVASMSFSQASPIPQSQSQSQGSSKKKKKRRKSTNIPSEAYEAIKESFSLLAGVIKKVSERLSRTIGEDMIQKHSQLRGELHRTTTINTMERHKAARMMMKDDALASYFFSILDEERDEWARALLAGDI